MALTTALTLRREIEAGLSARIPSALTPVPRSVRPIAATGIKSIDEFLHGGVPLGAISEVVGPNCSGRTSFALSFVAGLTQAAKVCAWVDVSDGLDPESGAATGVDMSRLLWVRCGVQSSKTRAAPEKTFVLPTKYLIPPPAKKGLHGGGGGSHPRHETKGMPEAVTCLLQAKPSTPQVHEPQRQSPKAIASSATTGNKRRWGTITKPWSRIEQALRVTDLLLQGGGFSAIVLDLSSVTAEYVSRVPLSTWFRYRAAVERTQASILLLTQVSCAKSSAELMLRLEPGKACRDEATVFTGIEHRIELARQRFTHTPTNVIPLRKPPKSITTAEWQSRTAWAGTR